MTSMQDDLSRRDYLKAMGAAAFAAGIGPIPPIAEATPPPPPRIPEDMRGIFVILSTPFTPAGEIDEIDLAREVAWVAEAGAHGIVWPQNSSGYARMSVDQIRQGMRVLARANRGTSMTLVLGVQQDGVREMVELARFADSLDPDMLIAMPPKVGTSLADYREYYVALAEATSRPVMIQTLPNLPGVEFDSALILDLASRYPHLGYVKEEAEPVFDRIGALVGKPGIRRVFSAQRGRHFQYDLRLGVDGIVSGMAMYVDAFTRLWSEYRAGNWDAVRDIHAAILLMLNTEDEIPGAGRYLLQRRGIFKHTTQGGRELTFTPTQIAHIEHNLMALQPYLLRLRV